MSSFLQLTIWEKQWFAFICIIIYLYLKKMKRIMYYIQSLKGGGGDNMWKYITILVQGQDTNLEMKNMQRPTVCSVLPLILPHWRYVGLFISHRWQTVKSVGLDNVLTLIMCYSAHIHQTGFLLETRVSIYWLRRWLPAVVVLRPIWIYQKNIQSSIIVGPQSATLTQQYIRILGCNEWFEFCLIWSTSAIPISQ